MQGRPETAGSETPLALSNPPPASAPSQGAGTARRIAFENDPPPLGAASPPPPAGKLQQGASAASDGGGGGGQSPGAGGSSGRLSGMSSALQSSIDALALSAKLANAKKGKAPPLAFASSTSGSGIHDEIPLRHQPGSSVGAPSYADGGRGWRGSSTASETVSGVDARPIPPPAVSGGPAGETDFSSIGHKFLERLKTEEQTKRHEQAKKRAQELQQSQQQQRAPIPYESFLLQHQHQQRRQQDVEQAAAAAAATTGVGAASAARQPLLPSSSPSQQQQQYGRLFATDGPSTSSTSPNGRIGVGSLSVGGGTSPSAALSNSRDALLVRELQERTQQQEQQIVRLQEERQRAKQQMQAEYDALYEQVPWGGEGGQGLGQEERQRAKRPSRRVRCTV